MASAEADCAGPTLRFADLDISYCRWILVELVASGRRKRELESMVMMSHAELQVLKDSLAQALDQVDQAFAILQAQSGTCHRWWRERGVEASVEDENLLVEVDECQSVCRQARVALEKTLVLVERAARRVS